MYTSMNRLNVKKLFSSKKITFALSFFLLIFNIQVTAQDSSYNNAALDTGKISQIIPLNDYLSEAAISKKSRLWLVSGVHTAAYAGSLLVLNEAWYKNYPKQGFTSFDDSKEWLQMDKIGHGWSAYNLSRGSTEAWKWAGLSDRKAAIIGSTSGFAFLTVIELLDARSTRWGFSWSDIAANTLGTGLFVSQQLAWNEQRIQFKFSFHRKNYVEKMLNDRTDQLFGKSWYERMLKDYNGQTYWLSANLKSFLKDSKLPPWLNIAFGYGAEGMFGGFENLVKDGNGTISFDRRDIARIRQFYLSPDIDLTKIKTKKKWIRTAFLMLNSFKFPMPAIMLNTKGRIRVHPFYF